MSTLPPLMRDQRKDADHLKLLAVFHFVLAGFFLFGLGFLFLHWLVLHTIFNPATLMHAKSGPPPEIFFLIFKCIYFIAGTWMVFMGLGNVISGCCLLKCRGRVFSLIMAGLNCVAFPFGTTLAVFTFIVLLRDSITKLYAARGQVADKVFPIPG